MEVDTFINTINYIVDQSCELKNKYITETTGSLEFVCIFCYNDEEYKHYTDVIKSLGRIIEDTKSGFTYLFDKEIETNAGSLRLVKIRKPDPTRPERGDADFNTDYRSLKEKYLHKSGFELVIRDTFEMVRLSDREFDVMACFSNIPKSKVLGIRL